MLLGSAPHTPLFSAAAAGRRSHERPQVTLDARGGKYLLSRGGWESRGEMVGESREEYLRRINSTKLSAPSGRGKKKVAHQLRRTCNDCQHRWFSPDEVAPSDLKIRGAKIQASGSRMTLFGGRRAASYSTDALRLEQQRDRVLASRRCPQCGSASYSEVRVAI